MRLYIFWSQESEIDYKGNTNTTGIPTKKYPSNHPSSFYTDDEYKENMCKISNAILKIRKISKNYNYIIFPENGFGTGFSDLPNRAP